MQITEAEVKTMQEQIRMAEERDLTNDPNSEAEEETGEKRRKQRKSY